MRWKERRAHPLVAVDPRTDNHSLHDAMRDPAVRVYGHRATIHSSEQLDICLNTAGDVVQVWFRCQQLPFSVSSIRRDDEGNPILPRLVAVEVIDDD